MKGVIPTEVENNLVGAKATLTNRVMRLTPHGKEISREDHVAKNEPGEWPALWLRVRVPDFVDGEL